MEEEGPFANNYGDVPLQELQSVNNPAGKWIEAVYGKKWTEVGALTDSLKDQKVLLRAVFTQTDPWETSWHSWWWEREVQLFNAWPLWDLILSASKWSSTSLRWARSPLLMSSVLSPSPIWKLREQHSRWRFKSKDYFELGKERKCPLQLKMLLEVKLDWESFEGRSTASSC